MKAFRLVWIVPEAQGGIRSYAEKLWPAVKKEWSGDAVDPIYELPRLDELKRLQPDILHVQHEFGLFGSKTPGVYCFPGWVREVKRALPRARIVATAHNVLGPDYHYEYAGRGWQIPLRFTINHTVLPFMRRSWLQGTWGGLQGVIVHSELQVDAVRGSGCPKVEVIPHYVPKATESWGLPATDSGSPVIVVFGFICPDKGQDVAIRGFSRMNRPARLVLAGGVRREKYQAYLDHCLKLAHELGVGDRVEVTGFVPFEKLDEVYRTASLVLAPFRETSGSGSLALAMARGCPILASDLPLNLEIDRRTSASLAFFKSEDAEDLAKKLGELLSNSEGRLRLSKGAIQYAASNSPEIIAQKHCEFYLKV